MFAKKKIRTTTRCIDLITMVKSYCFRFFEILLIFPFIWNWLLTLDRLSLSDRQPLAIISIAKLNLIQLAVNLANISSFALGKDPYSVQGFPLFIFTTKRFVETIATNTHSTDSPKERSKWNQKNISNSHSQFTTDKTKHTNAKHPIQFIIKNPSLIKLVSYRLWHWRRNR